MNEKLPSSNIEAEKKLETLIQDLKELSIIDSLSGHEAEIRSHLKETLEGLGLRCSIDGKGNLWVESEDDGQKDILLSAHMDKVGKGKEVVVDGERLRGRLDDTLGLSIILQLIRQGLRPSALFTVEEESQTEVERDGK